jgi:hypothetical protein
VESSAGVVSSTIGVRREPIERGRGQTAPQMLDEGSLALGQVVPVEFLVAEDEEDEIMEPHEAGKLLPPERRQGHGTARR